MDQLTQPSSSRKEPMLGYPIIDSDAHMIEPDDLWSSRIDHRFRSSAPHVVDEYKGKKGRFWLFEDCVQNLASLSNARPGGWDPAERLKDMKLDGISGAVVYTTLGFFIFGARDIDVQEACFRVYNDWLSEFCNHAPDRLVGLGMISLYNVDNGIRELERCRRMGLKGVMIWATPPIEKPPYSTKEYDRFWAAAQDLDAPIAMHIHTSGTRTKAVDYSSYGSWGPFYTNMVMAPTVIQDSILQMTYGGVLHRFPRLRIISAEGDLYWVPGLLQRADKYFSKRGRRGHQFEMDMPPSEYIRRQVWFSIIEDPIGLKTYKLAGVADRVMWSTDYPHPSSSFPHSMDVMDRDFVDVSPEDKRKMLHDNVADLFGFTL